MVGWTVLAGVLALGVLGAAAFGLRWFQPTAGRPAPRVAAPPLPDTDPRRIKELVLQEARTAADRYRRECSGLVPIGLIENRADEPVDVAEIAVHDGALDLAMNAAGAEASEWFAMIADGHTYREIAVRYGVPVCRVRSRLARARQRARATRTDEQTRGEV